MNWVSTCKSNWHHSVKTIHLTGLTNYYKFLLTIGCPHSQLLGVNGLVSPSNRLLLLGNYIHLIQLALTMTAFNQKHQISWH